MNAEQAANFRTLIQHMDTKCGRVLNMESFYYQCGAPACAIGEAESIPELQEKGVKQGYMEEWGPRVFGLIPGCTTWARLFGRATCNAWHRGDVTPREWAAEARKVLAEYGHSMSDDPADTFIERIKKLTPLDEPVTA